MKTTLAILLTLSLYSPAPAQAPPAAPAAGRGGAAQIEAALKAADANGDGKITKEEAGGAPWFDRLDQNQDGVLDAAELERVRKGMAAGGGGKLAPGTGPQAGQFEAMVKNLDKNSDGKITKEEAGGAPWFDRLDQNKDGVVDAAELETVRKAMTAGAGAKPAAGKPAPGRRPGRPVGRDGEESRQELGWKNLEGRGGRRRVVRPPGSEPGPSDRCRRVGETAKG
jgi:Ca2+-binding EF-hand superfamily protein